MDAEGPRTVLAGRQPQGLDLRPRTHPDALLEDNWWYFDMTPEERDRQTRSLCRVALRVLQTKSAEELEAIRWAKAWGADYGLLRRWAREFHGRASPKS
jgi:hypothetical protein